MSRLQEGLSRLLGRVEILARGADDLRRAAEQALTRGHALEARAHARALLDRVPGSVVGLALWAEAAEACYLHDEVVTALEALCERAPWRAEIWLRLGIAVRDSAPARARAALERASAAGASPSCSRRALLALADLDLRAGVPARADRWLDRVPQHPGQPDAELALRRAECALALGADDRARQQLEIASGRGGGRLRLLRARLARACGEGEQAARHTHAALLLEIPGAADLAVEMVSAMQAGNWLGSLRAAAIEVGLADQPRWQAALAVAEGRRADASATLLDACTDGDPAAGAALLTLACHWRDIELLRELDRASDQALPPGARLLLTADAQRRGGQPAAALVTLDRAMSTPLAAWAGHQASAWIAGWVGGERTTGGSRWPQIAGELRRAAGTVGALTLLPAIEALVVAPDQPLRVAVLGEFNAGKSTLINALLGTEVAPTGARPTTACAHLVAWAPDRFARVVVAGADDRVVGHEALRATLRRIEADGLRTERVIIYAPIERLKRIEILDTPGFNAAARTHGDEARAAIEQAHVGLWLLDATAPLKESERRIITQIVQAGVPVGVLVNKRDRLSGTELDEVMQYVNDAIHLSNIKPIAPPLAVSARLALAGRQGDRQALKCSGYAALEAFLTEHIVNRCDALRERALRRSAAAVARRLLARQRDRAGAERQAQQRRRARREALAALAARLRTHQRLLAADLITTIAPAAEQLETDLAPLPPPEAARDGEGELRHYVADRARERLLGPVSNAIVKLADGLGPERPAGAQLHQLIDGPLSAVLASAATTAWGARPLAEAWPLAADTAISVAADAIDDALGDEPAGPHDAALTLRLGALAAALEEGEPTWTSTDKPAPGAASPAATAPK